MTTRAAPSSSRNRIKQAVNNCRGRPLTHWQAERLLEPWRALRR
jgi:hypothetical protein